MCWLACRCCLSLCWQMELLRLNNDLCDAADALEVTVSGTGGVEDAIRARDVAEAKVQPCTAPSDRALDNVFNSQFMREWMAA